MGESWNRRELGILRGLETPWQVQEWLDAVRYSSDSFYRSPQRVMRDRRAHCVDGALLAAAAMERMGHPARVVWMTAERDDGHMVAVFKVRGLWGAVAKSNFLTIRYREPVYRTLRELVMSYFDGFFNAQGERSMRGYTRPLNLARFDGLHWRMRDEGLPAIIDDAVDRLKVWPVAPRGVIDRLNRIDARMLRTIMRETDPRGLYKPG